MDNILSMKDRVKLTLGDIVLTLKPLTILEQAQVSSHKKMEAGVEVEDVLMSAFAYVKTALKEIEGVKHNGEDYKLEFEGDYLTDDCVSEIFTLKLGAEFYHVVQSLKHNVIDEKPTYFGSKKKLKDVSLEVITFGGQKK